MLIVGDYTARIGDPSGRSKERPVLSTEELDANARTFAEQAFRILDRERTEVRYNSEWLGQLDFAGVLGLTRTTTVARLLERDDFARRLAAEEPISISELLYPLMQGYDSVAIEADVELGGTDQLYNLLCGRDVMEAYGLEPQVALTLPILVGTDGRDRMSKSKGNYIGVAELARGAVREADVDPGHGHRGLLATVPGRGASSPASRWRRSSSWPGGSCAATTARRRPSPAEAHFTRVVRRHEAPEEVPEVRVRAEGESAWLPGLLRTWFDLPSTSEGRRLVEQGGVRVAGAVVRDERVPWSEPRRGARAGREAPVRTDRGRVALRLTGHGALLSFARCLAAAPWSLGTFDLGEPFS